jgi:hypothetical protein
LLGQTRGKSVPVLSAYLGTPSQIKTAASALRITME